jgi:hypothetical protein
MIDTNYALKLRDNGDTVSGAIGAAARDFSRSFRPDC